MSEIRVGDRVEITRYREYDDSGEGLVGSVRQIDNDDLPYLVETETEGDLWAREVRKLSDGAPPSRDALVARAKEHLAGTPHTADDILRMARFLAE